MVRWNLDREIQFSEQWTYLPISPKDLIITQWLLTDQAREHIEQSASPNGGVSSMFSAVQLSQDDADHIFGLTDAFKEAMPSLPSVLEAEQDVSSAAECIVEFAFSDTCTVDPIVEKLVNEGCNILDECGIEEAIKNATDPNEYQPVAVDVSETRTDAHDGVNQDTAGVVRRGRRKRDRRQAPNTHQTGSRSHKRQGIVAQLGSRRFGPEQSVQLWNDVFNSIGEAFNPIERRLLRFIVLRMENGEAT